MVMYGFLLIIILVLFSACSKEDEKQEDEKQEDEKPKTMELVFLEKTDEYETGRLVLESREKQEYYYVTLSGWEFDNFENDIGIKENEVVELKTDISKRDVYELALGIEAGDCVELFDDCKRLNSFTTYKRTN